MAFKQSFTTPGPDMSGLLDLCASIGQKAQAVGGEFASLQTRNFENAARAGRALVEARDIGALARVQADFLQNSMSAYADHIGKIAEIVMTAGREAATETKDAAQAATEQFRDRTADLRASVATLPAAKGIGV